jgi:PAS domain S-box-containing protein
MTQKGVVNYGEGSAKFNKGNEDATFGENSACAIVILSLKTDQVGTIIHTNEEMYRILGHKRKNLIGQKINIIQPRPIAEVHDTILKRFLGKSKQSSFLNTPQKLQAITEDGYIRPI